MAFVDALRPLRIACLYGVFTERHDAFVRKVLGTTFRSVHVGDLPYENERVILGHIGPIFPIIVRFFPVFCDLTRYSYWMM